MAVPGRHSRIWPNLPLRVKAGACLLLPIPVMELCATVTGIFGFFRFPAFLAVAAALELLAFLWVIEAAHRRIRELRWATDLVRQGESLPSLPAYSWESNAVQRNLQLLISDLRRYHAETAESRGEAARLFEESPAAYLETDASGLVTRVNPSACRLLERPADEIRGLCLWDLFGASEGLAGQSEFRARVERQEAAAAFDQRYVRPDGTKMMVAIEERLLRDGSTGIRGVWCTLTDRTSALRAAETVVRCDTALQVKKQDLAKVQAELAEARQAEARFLAKVSNDLRAPLHTIVGFTELMLDGKVGSRIAERRECLRDILSSAQDLSRMVDRLLDQGKPESAGTVLYVHRKAASETTSALQEAAGCLRYALEDAGIRGDCGRPILVAGRTLHGVKSLTDLVESLGHDPIGLPDISEILGRAEREQPAGVVVEMQNDGSPDCEFVRRTLLDGGLAVPVIGFRAETDSAKPAARLATAAASSEAQPARPRLRSWTARQKRSA